MKRLLIVTAIVLAGAAWTPAFAGSSTHRPRHQTGGTRAGGSGSSAGAARDHLGSDAGSGRAGDAPERSLDSATDNGHGTSGSVGTGAGSGSHMGSGAASGPGVMGAGMGNGSGTGGGMGSGTGNHRSGGAPK